MKRLLIALTLALVVLPAAAWSAATPPDVTFDNAYTNGIAEGWTAYGAGMWTQVVGENGVGSAQQIAAYPDGEGGVYAQFDTLADMEYTIGVSMNSNWAGSAGALAVDWNGGTDFTTLSWQAWTYQDAANVWQQVSSTGVATGDKITVFLDAYSGGAMFDNLTGIGDQPTVPEPGSLLALSTGLVGLVGIIRRRK